MDYTQYTAAELTAMAHALDVIGSELDDEALPAGFGDILDGYLDMGEEERFAYLADITRAANVSAYAQAVDNPLDLVTPILTDEQAADVPSAFHAWEVGVAYASGNRVQHGGKLWKCLQAHTSQAGWEPGVAPSLWVEVAKPGEIPDWKQPTGAQDAYSKGDKVKHNAKVWVSNVDNNVWEPGVYGWDEAA